MSQGKKGSANLPQRPAPGEVLYPWLPPDEEANRMGYYVPSPQQIQSACDRMRSDPNRRIAYHESANGMCHVPVRRHAFEGGVPCRE